MLHPCNYTEWTYIYLWSWPLHESAALATGGTHCVSTLDDHQMVTFGLKLGL
jgi:hypothetical protein